MTDNTNSAPTVRYPNCNVELSRASANFYGVTGMVRRELRLYLVREAGMTRDQAEAEVERFTEEAKSGDYDNALMTCHRWVSVY